MNFSRSFLVTLEKKLGEFCGMWGLNSRTLFWGWGSFSIVLVKNEWISHSPLSMSTLYCTLFFDKLLEQCSCRLHATTPQFVIFFSFLFLYTSRMRSPIPTSFCFFFENFFLPFLFREPDQVRSWKLQENGVGRAKEEVAFLTMHTQKGGGRCRHSPLCHH